MSHSPRIEYLLCHSCCSDASLFSSQVRRRSVQNDRLFPSFMSPFLPPHPPHPRSTSRLNTIALHIVCSYEWAGLVCREWHCSGHNHTQYLHVRMQCFLPHLVSHLALHLLHLLHGYTTSSSPPTLLLCLLLLFLSWFFTTFWPWNHHRWPRSRENRGPLQGALNTYSCTIICSKLVLCSLRLNYILSYCRHYLHTHHTCTWMHTYCHVHCCVVSSCTNMHHCVLLSPTLYPCSNHQKCLT